MRFTLPKDKAALKRPKMVLFDYGHTLVSEGIYDMPAGFAAVFPYITKNPRGHSVESLNALDLEIYNKTIAAKQECNIEVRQTERWRAMFESEGIELSISLSAAEKIFLQACSSFEPMPGIEELIDRLAAANIKTGVISNIGFSGETLAQRINAAIPGNRFEFILASSEYAFRKPEPFMFRAALAKGGVGAEDAWHCGDSVTADIEGAAAAGIFPVLYESGKTRHYIVDKTTKTQRDYLHITSWDELFAVI